MIIILHDNNTEVLETIRKAANIEEIHKLATEQGLIASHTFDMRWISLALTPTSEDIFVAREVESVTFEGKEYPVRTFDVRFIDEDRGDEENYITIAPESLSIAMGDNKEVEDTEANNLDCTIYFYVLDEHMGLEAEDICKNHLDEPIDFVEEIFE